MNVDKMRAVICTKYGPPEVLKIELIQKPIPKSDEILIKIIAASVNSGDVRVRGLVIEGFLKIVMRFVLGLTKPRKPILGTVFSGIVEQAGKNVMSYKVGDELLGTTGFKFGTYAEYITVSEKSVVSKKPSNATFEEAAAIPFGALTAIYFLDKAKIENRSNPKVLIYGATGSTGTAAIHLSKKYGAEVTAICSERGENLARELGADKIILYDKEDFTNGVNKFDLIFDAVGKTTRRQMSHLLNEKGKYITVGGLEVAAERKKDLEFLCKLYEAGEFKAAIDKTYNLSEIIEAHRYVDTGRKKGNVVIKISA